MSPILPFTLRRSNTGWYLILIATIALMFLALIGSVYWPDPAIQPLLPVVALGVFLFGTGLSIWYWSAYIIISSTGITFVNYTGFSATDAETDWKKLQDVTFKENGIFQSLFNVGTLYVQTSGTNTPFKLSWIGRVEDWAKYLESQLESNS